MNNEEVKKYLQHHEQRDEHCPMQALERDHLFYDSIEGLTYFLKNKDLQQIEKLEQELLSNIDQTMQKRLRRRCILFFERIRYSATACILGIFGCFGIQLLKKSTTNSDTLFNTYFKPLTPPDVTIRGEKNPTEESAATRAYEREDYYAAIRYYERAIENNPGNIKNHLFLGISLLATHQEQKAIEILGHISSSEHYYFDIHWYLALAYIKNKEIENARTELFKLTAQENYYQYGSMLLLEKLNHSSNSENR
jgi:predicted Zn-dependent protease